MEQKQFSMIRPVAWYDMPSDTIRLQIYAEDNGGKAYSASIQWSEVPADERVEPMIVFSSRVGPVDYFGNHPLRTFVNQLWEAGIRPTPDTDNRDKTIKAQLETIRVLEEDIKFLRTVIDKIQSPIIVKDCGECSCELPDDYVTRKIGEQAEHFSKIGVEPVVGTDNPSQFLSAFTIERSFDGLPFMVNCKDIPTLVMIPDDFAPIFKLSYSPGTERDEHFFTLFQDRGYDLIGKIEPTRDDDPRKIAHLVYQHRDSESL